MKLGLHIASTSWEGGAGRLRSTWAKSSRPRKPAGLDTIDVADHLWQHPIMSGPEVSQLEA
jgi:hypothetical protein